MKITNDHNISLPLAAWLLYDDYDYINEPSYISATSLLKPTKQLVLSKRIPSSERTSDLSDFVARAFGRSIHTAVETAWTSNPKAALKQLGYPDSVLERVVVNPTEEQLKEIKNPIAIYFEKRSLRELDGFTVGGKFDLVADGIVQDIKTTSVYTYMNDRKLEDYKLQLSIYRWLNPDLITEDYGYINFVFTDWQKFKAKSDPKYPKTRLATQRIELMSLEETEEFIRQRLRAYKSALGADEDMMPRCTDKELWRSDPVYKYYKDPSKINSPRATKNFSDLSEARRHMMMEGKGKIVTVEGVPKACDYCAAYALCKQKDEYFKPE